MITLNNLQTKLEQAVTIPEKHAARFFKTQPGEYAHHDIFMGIKVPALRTLAKEFKDLTYNDLQHLLNSNINEKRALALFILIQKYTTHNAHEQQKIYDFYLENLDQINNWNLVDASAPYIIGAYLLHKQDKSMLLTLAQSSDMWHRRIAIVATFYFIRNNNLEWTFSLAQLLRNDTHDLIHKAVGWMLREAGKKDKDQLILFLEKNASKMPRTMLRYAIEKFPEKERKAFLIR